MLCRESGIRGPFSAFHRRLPNGFRSFRVEINPVAIPRPERIRSVGRFPWEVASEAPPSRSRCRVRHCRKRANRRRSGDYPATSLSSQSETLRRKSIGRDSKHRGRTPRPPSFPSARIRKQCTCRRAKCADLDRRELEEMRLGGWTSRLRLAANSSRQNAAAIAHLGVGESVAGARKPLAMLHPGQREASPVFRRRAERARDAGPSCRGETGCPLPRQYP